MKLGKINNHFYFHIIKQHIKTNKQKSPVSVKLQNQQNEQSKNNRHPEITFKVLDTKFSPNDQTGWSPPQVTITSST